MQGISGKYDNIKNGDCEQDLNLCELQSTRRGDRPHQRTRNRAAMVEMGCGPIPKVKPSLPSADCRSHMFKFYWDPPFEGLCHGVRETWLNKHGYANIVPLPGRVRDVTPQSSLGIIRQLVPTSANDFSRYPQVDRRCSFPCIRLHLKGSCVPVWIGCFTDVSEIYPQHPLCEVLSAICQRF